MDDSMLYPGTMSDQVLIALSEVSYSYHMGTQLQPVLFEISLNIFRGQSCAILGTSGSGKSTLLNILGLLDRPSSGLFNFAQRNILETSPDELALIRNREIGFVFQNFNLLPRLTALDNVALPLIYRGYTRAQARQFAKEQIQRVGLGKRAGHRPAELSGGQRQRVAIARALAGNPSLILADEPTGNLDTSTANDIMDLLLELNRQQSVTLVMVTHDVQIAEHFDRRLDVCNGRLTESLLHRASHD